jgi:hypothetical protein
MEGTMFARLFPKQLDNAYRGHWLALILFGLLLVISAGIGGNSILNTHEVAIGADGIPLDSFSPTAAKEVMLEFALLGMWRLLFVLIGLVALIRYRAMIPFLFLVLLIQQIAGRALHVLHPTDGDLTSRGSVVVWVMLGMIVVGFVLSLIGRSKPADA